MYRPQLTCVSADLCGSTRVANYTRADRKGGSSSLFEERPKLFVSPHSPNHRVHRRSARRQKTHCLQVGLAAITQVIPTRFDVDLLPKSGARRRTTLVRRPTMLLWPSRYLFMPPVCLCQSRLRRE